MIEREVKLSPAFKKQVVKSILAICLFVFTYALLLFSAIGLTVFSMFIGIRLVVSFPRLITIGLGIGLASLGILILIFLIKFIFKSHKVDRSDLKEIKKEQEPELFALIEDIVDKVGTSFPKKVFLSNDVNASVFYDSSFWSMFFPIKKNLQIGIGLVNTISHSELKAILSHEFGHFSQKSMKVGSYVYNVNHIIYNMLYDNESYDKLIKNWASISDYISIFVVIAVKIIEGVQWILKSIYSILNKSYMGLSREMEFHADEIAASVTGYEPLKTSLLRLTLADHSFNTVLSFYEKKIGDNTISENIFEEQFFVMNFIAKTEKITINNNLPQVTEEEINKFNKSKLVIKDQWSSHPSTEDRIKMLERTNYNAEFIDNSPANHLFKDIVSIQKELTNKLFKNIKYKGQIAKLTISQFKEEYKADVEKFSFDPFYNGYYDDKNPTYNMDTLNHMSIDDTDVTELFSEEKVNWIYTSIALQKDMEYLNNIANKTLPIKTFEYDGVKYKRRQSKTLIAKLEKEYKEIMDAIQLNDSRVFTFFYHAEELKNNEKQLETMYREFFNFDTIYDKNIETCNKISNKLQFLNYNTTFETIKSNFEWIRPFENKLKEQIKEILEDSKYKDEITTEIRESFELYLSKDWTYFLNESYLDKNLEILIASIDNYAMILSKGYFLTKKELLNYQIQCLNK